MAKIGRPSSYTEEIAASICERIANGDSAKEACKALKVNEGTLYEWLKKDAAFQERYAHARERQADKYASEIVAIADELQVEAHYQGEDVKLDVSSASVARNRLRVDARKWVASKLAPKKYGEKLEVAGDAESPLTVVVRKLTDA